MDTLLNDVRFALRLIRKSPGFSIIAVLTLAIGIGANTAMFSFVDAVLLHPLPYPHPEQIVNVWEKPPNYDRNGISTLNFLDWKNQNTVFTAMAAMTGGSFTLTGVSTPVQLHGMRVSAPWFDIMGIKPALGRTFAPDEDQPGKGEVVVLSNRIWESRFGADRAIIGRTIGLNGKPYTVIGVMPSSSPIERGWPDVFAPLVFQPADMTRDFHWMMSWARLKPGVTLQQARAQMKSIAARIEHDFPNSNKGWSATVDSFEERAVDPNLRRSLLVLLAAVAAILLIGCANLANLLLARGAWRECEVAIRSALGAGRWRLMTQFLTESVVLSFFGGMVGLALGYGLMFALKAALPPFMLPAEADVRLDFRVLLFTAGAVIATTIIFGLGPAFQAAHTEHGQALKEASRGMTSGAAKQRLRSVLVVAEVALAFVLLSGAMLLIRSFYHLQQVDPGFETTNVIAMDLPMDEKEYPDAARVTSYLGQVMERIGAVPGVRDVASTTALPLQGWGWGMPFLIEGQQVDRAKRPGCYFKMVSPSYFRALGMKVRQGRALAETDTAGSVPAIVINESLAKRYFKATQPVGKRIFIQQIITGKHELGPEVPWQVVGVVADEKVSGLDDSSPGVYVSYKQSPTPGNSLVVRGAMDPNLLVKSIQQAVRSVNKNQALDNIKTLEQIKSESLGPNRLRTALLGVFAGVALLLAAIGIYGVISGSVAQRTHEMGLRAALGASVTDQLRLVLGSGMAMTGIGLAIGVGGSLAVTQLLAGLLFGVTARDPLTLVLVTGILGAVALAACYVPAWRATRVDPMVALRYE
jgi:putative ABC transport system permease protein